MKRVVVDGATSMLGLALINECIENQVQVLAIARAESTRRDRIPKSKWVQIIDGDLEDLKDLKPNTDDSYDVYYHFAWGNTGHEGRLAPFLQEPNVGYTLDAIHLANRLGCKLFIGAGSQAEYGRVSGIIEPETPVNPEVAYGVAKYAAGKMAMLQCSKLRIGCIWTRIFSVYGIGDTSSTLIMYAIDQLLNGQKPTFTKAEQNWDYLYSKDAGRAFFLLGEKGRTGKVYCIGSGVARSLNEYIYQLRDAIDPELPLGIGEREYSPQQVMNLQADITSLKEDTGFEPIYSFEEGICETIEWCKKN